MKRVELIQMVEKFNEQVSADFVKAFVDPYPFKAWADPCSKTGVYVSVFMDPGDLWLDCRTKWTSPDLAQILYPKWARMEKLAREHLAGLTAQGGVQ